MSKRDSLVYGAVLTTWFPFVETPDRKLRPVVVVSNDTFNSIPFTYKQATVALITSIPPPILCEHHILVEEGTQEFKDSGLIKSSYIRLDKLFSTDERAINKFIGKFSDEFMKKVSEKCKAIF